MPKQKNETDHRILGFGQLPEGWNYGEGSPIPNDVIEYARSINQAAVDSGFEVTEAFPRTDGNIQLMAHYHTFTIDMIVKNSGRLDYWLDNADNTLIFKENITIIDVQSLLAYWGGLWRSSDFSIQSTTTVLTSEDLSVPLSTLAATAESQLLIPIVLKESKKGSATTLMNTTLRSSAILYHFASSSLKSSLTTAA